MQESLVGAGSQPQRGLGTTVTHGQTKAGSAPQPGQTFAPHHESSSWPRAGGQRVPEERREIVVSSSVFHLVSLKV